MHSKLTGAGGGGCAFTLVTPGTVNVDRDRRAIWHIFFCEMRVIEYN